MRQRGKDLALAVLATGAMAATVAAGCNEHRSSPGTGSGSDGLPPGATAVVSAAPAPAPAPASPPAGAEPSRLSSFAPIVKAADPSVVTINTVGEDVEVSPFFRQRRRQVTHGLGTGFVFDKTGIILTNNHVVENSTAIQVKLTDQRTFPAKVVGTDPVTDIAVVRIEAKDLRPMPLGDSDSAEVGDWAVAIGNPFGLSHTVSAGIISAKGRTNQDVQLDPAGYYDFIQTDASINPGNSGGPLLNLRGEVIGINSAIRGGGAQGIGFAIPINMVKQLLPMLLRDGHVTRSALGVQIGDLTDIPREVREEYGLNEEGLRGAVIEAEVPNGPAATAGLQPGDDIVAFDGTPVEHSSQLRWLASTAGVGRQVTLRVSRKGKQFDLKVTLGKLPERERVQSEQP
jgi:serine protease Do